MFVKDEKGYFIPIKKIGGYTRNGRCAAEYSTDGSIHDRHDRFTIGQFYDLYDQTISCCDKGAVKCVKKRGGTPYICACFEYSPQDQVCQTSNQCCQDDEINIGDVVMLKSNGPKMTVQHIGSYGHSYKENEKEYKCTWYDGNNFRNDIFVKEQLVKA